VLRKQAQCFWSQARADYSTALTLRDVGIYYASVFFCQQTAEKALKAASLDRQQRAPKGHNLIQIANSLEAPLDVMNASAELNVEFITSRNPDATDGVPAQLFDKESADIHLSAAEVILNWVKAII